MNWRPFAVSRTKRFLQLIAASAILSAVANVTAAAILVGTVVTSGTETVAEINQLIADYNSDFGGSLPSVSDLLDKLEGQNSAAFVLGNLQLGNFNFYEENNAGTTTLNIFDATVKFTGSSLGPAAGFDTLDQNVFAFQQLSGPSFDYYVSKDGNLGWSLWAAGAGLSPVYTDAGVGASSLVGTGFTRGSITNSSLAYDPIKSGVSHISFYSGGPHTEVPEPGVFVALCVTAGSLCVFRARRSRV